MENKTSKDLTPCNLESKFRSHFKTGFFSLCQIVTKLFMNYPNFKNLNIPDPGFNVFALQALCKQMGKEVSC